MRHTVMCADGFCYCRLCIAHWAEGEAMLLSPRSNLLVRGACFFTVDVDRGAGDQAPSLARGRRRAWPRRPCKHSRLRRGYGCISGALRFAAAARPSLGGVVALAGRGDFLAYVDLPRLGEVAAASQRSLPSVSVTERRRPAQCQESSATSRCPGRAYRRSRGAEPQGARLRRRLWSV